MSLAKDPLQVPGAGLQAVCKDCQLTFQRGLLDGVSPFFQYTDLNIILTTQKLNVLLV